LPASQVASLQRNAKFVIVPSKWDTFNLSAVEAMWAQRVVICSDAAGAATLIEHGKNGFCFPSGDAQRLSELILKVKGMSL